MKASLIFALGLITPCAAAPQLTLIVTGLSKPVWAIATPSKPNHLYILEKDGVIRLLNLNTGKVQQQAFLDISAQIKIRMNEQGLLGMAFDPDFSSNGRYYLNYTNLNGDTQIARFECDPKSAKVTIPGSEKTILSIDQPYKNHNGGWIGFGPNNFLYIATGDGGAGNDPKNYSQNMQSLLGKMLRIDISQNEPYSIPSSNPYPDDKKIRPEIYAHGLRNPWRCDWDTETNHLFIADVGQNAEEEINYVSHDKLKAANFGWRLREGAITTPKKKIGGEASNNHTEPIYSYKHGIGKAEGLSITGGFIYRGKIDSLKGHYFFADWVNPRLWSFQVKAKKPINFTDWTDRFDLKKHKVSRISSFGRDAYGEIYLMDHDKGTLFKIEDK